MEERLEYLIDDIQYELKRDPELEDVIKEGVRKILKKIQEYKENRKKLEENYKKRKK